MIVMPIVAYKKEPKMNSFFKHLLHLFHAEAPKAESLLRPEIDALEKLAVKFDAVDLKAASTVILSGLTASLPIQNVIASGAAALKSAAADLSVDVTDEELGLLAQVLTKHQASTINATVKAVQDAETAAKAAA